MSKFVEAFFILTIADSSTQIIKKGREQKQLIHTKVLQFRIYSIHVYFARQPRWIKINTTIVFQLGASAQNNRIYTQVGPKFLHFSFVLTEWDGHFDVSYVVF